MYRSETDDLGMLMLRTTPDKYEEFILAACLTDEDFWTRAKSCICLRKKDMFEVEVNDFTDISRYWLFCAIRNYRKALGKFSDLNDAAVVLGLQVAASQGKDVPLAGEEFDKIINLFHSLAPITKENAQAVVQNTWITWITYAQLNYAMADIRRGGFSGDIMAKADMLSKIKSDIMEVTKTSDDIVSSVADLWIVEEDNTERIPLSRTLESINRVTAGGPGKGEHILAVVPTGGGKTVLACQMAADVAAAGRHVLLISTEQHAVQLIPRIVSCMSYQMSTNRYGKIPSKGIKDGITRAKVLEFSEEQKKIHNMILEAIGPYLHIASWSGGAYTVSDIPAMLDRENAKLPEGTKIDMVILDWIGGAITKGVTDSGKKRLILLSAAQEMHRLAESHNVACMSTCQSTEKGKHVWELTSDHIQEAKYMADEAEVAFGISCMKADSSGDLPADGSSVYSIKQMFNCFKARKAEPIKTYIERNFDYQRFNKI